MSKTRRTPEQVAIAVAQIDELRATGMDADAAADKIGLARSVYWRAHKKAKGPKKPNGQTRPVRVTGSVRADSLPPRPLRGGKRAPRPVNLNDVASVANRISKIDNKLKQFSFLTRERERLSLHLIGMLKKK